MSLDVAFDVKKTKEDGLCLFMYWAPLPSEASPARDRHELRLCRKLRTERESETILSAVAEVRDLMQGRCDRLEEQLQLSKAEQAKEKRALEAKIAELQKIAADLRQAASSADSAMVSMRTEKRILLDNLRETLSQATDSGELINDLKWRLESMSTEYGTVGTAAKYLVGVAATLSNRLTVTNQSIRNLLTLPTNEAQSANYALKY